MAAFYGTLAPAACKRRTICESRWSSSTWSESSMPAEIREAYDISERTLRRWARAYRKGGLKALKPKRRGPRRRPPNSTKKRMEERILALKQRHPSWGARRIKYQYDLPCHWTTVHGSSSATGYSSGSRRSPSPRRGSRGTTSTRCGKETRSSSA